MNISQMISEFIAKNFLQGQSQGFTPSTSLIELGILDSIGILKVMRFLEENFSIKIEDEEYIPEYYVSVERIESFVKDKLAAKTMSA
ncbi:MAG: acyl carrier protein [Candidatus Brocadiae bacterium]|nr:acyl carrier protein [Candidatus Brocadiia bacterium]